VTQNPVNPRQAGRPRDHEKAAAILDAAWAMFLERGVNATSIEAIASQAGVSKVTLYSHYPDKSALFEAAVLREMEAIEAAQRGPANAPPPKDLEAQLTQFGLGIMSFLVTKPAIDFYSVIAGELRRYPDLAQAFYRLGPGRTRANLAQILANAATAGAIKIDNPTAAADHLFGLWQGMTNYQLALGIDVETIRNSVADRVAKGVSSFLRAYQKS
jgi:TetR/AcrR family transcriptional repressor of mexJK operon